MLGCSLYHFYDGLWYDPAERRTHDLLCERRTRYRLSQPDTVTNSTQISVFCIRHREVRGPAAEAAWAVRGWAAVASDLHPAARRRRGPHTAPPGGLLPPAPTAGPEWGWGHIHTRRSGSRPGREAASVQCTEVRNRH